MIISVGIFMTGPMMTSGFKERQMTADNWLFITIMGVIILAAYLNATKPKITEEERKEMEDEWWG
jgi:threonine/homoserine efflux transporter RhtA